MSDIRLVLVSCCAPCSVGAIQQLQGGHFPEISDFVVLFYNPNIYPMDEYQKRLAEQVRFCKDNDIKYFVGDYDHAAWLDSIKSNEADPERGNRCTECFKHRFRFAQNWALENGYNAIASVLGVSRHKNQNQVDNAATSVLDSIKYIPLKFDDTLRQKINHETDFYRQKYCGCEFSIRK